MLSPSQSGNGKRSLSHCSTRGSPGDDPSEGGSQFHPLASVLAAVQISLSDCQTIDALLLYFHTHCYSMQNAIAFHLSLSHVSMTTILTQHQDHAIDFHLNALSQIDFATDHQGNCDEGA